MLVVVINKINESPKSAFVNRSAPGMSKGQQSVSAKDIEFNQNTEYTKYSVISKPTNVNITNFGTAGSTTYSYRIKALDETTESIATNASITTTGNSVLSSTNFNRIKWDWVDVSGNKKILLIVWLFFLFFSIFYNKYYLALAYTVGLLIISLYSYQKDGSFGSLWCWSINSLMLFYAIKLLVILPYKENGLC